MFEKMKEEEARQHILEEVKEYAQRYKNAGKEFAPGDRISYASRVFDYEEMVNLVDSSLEFWLTGGKYTDIFEKKFAEYLGVRYVSLVNSGSSANLCAFMALTADELGNRKINRGDEVITVAACFPTTITPIIQYGAVPVFLDISSETYNIDTTFLEEAYKEGKTKAVILAHTLGNPFDIKTVKEFCDKHSLWLIEDNCDALGSKYVLDGKEQFTGTIGDIGTSSFYPPHHMTMGEGGAVYTNNPLLNKLIRSMRDWGRDCICPSGMDNMCKHRFDGQFGELQKGYDHKYVYSHFGYNLKATDMQASIGVAQLSKLPAFTVARKENHKYLMEKLSGLQEKGLVLLPVKTENSDPSWFGFMITLTKKSKISRNELVRKLEESGIQTRMLFSGNIIKHPCFDSMRKNEEGFRVVGNLDNTDYVMNNSFWIGVYPGMTREKLDYMAEKIKEFTI